MAAFFSLRRRGPLKSDERVGILSLILPLLLHFTILGHRNAQNMPPHYIGKRGNKTDEKRSNKKASWNDPNFFRFFSFFQASHYKMYLKTLHIFLCATLMVSFVFFSSFAR